MQEATVGSQRQGHVFERPVAHAANAGALHERTVGPTTPDALDAAIGPFYDTASVRTLLKGASRQAVESRRKKHTILAVKTNDGRWAYPTFQFTGRDVDPALVPAIQAFRDAPAWSVALWFLTPNPDLDDATPLEWARSGRLTGALVTSVRRTVGEWQ